MAGRRMLSLEERARRPWDIGAKLELSRQIADEELLISKQRAMARGQNHAHNDDLDAMRHARWSQRTAAAAGPVFANLAGIAHEAENLAESVVAHGRAVGPYEPGRRSTPGETIDEIRMDLHNNAEGRRAAREGRPIDPARLQASPRTPALTALYRYPPAGRTGLPSR